MEYEYWSPTDIPAEMWYLIAAQLDGIDMLRLGNSCCYLRQLIRKDTYFERLWRECAVREAIDHEIGPRAIHRKDEQGGSSAHRDSVLKDGHCNPPSLGRCKNKQHYFRNTLENRFPPLRPKSYARYYVGHLRKQHTKRATKQRELTRKRQAHNDLCERIKKRPWLLNELNKFYTASLQKEDCMVRLSRTKRLYLERFADLHP